MMDGTEKFVEGGGGSRAKELLKFSQKRLFFAEPRLEPFDVLTSSLVSLMNTHVHHKIMNYIGVLRAKANKAIAYNTVQCNWIQ